MIYGTGIDIVRTQRVREAVERWGDKFLARVFTRDEIDYAYRKKDPFPSLSARFAAKEAFIKALSHDHNIPLLDIEVRNQDNGRPMLELHGQTGDFLKKREIRALHLSLSHEKDYGVACVVIEGVR